MSTSPNPTTWMTDLASKLAPRPLASVALPGTHDSGTYGITRRSKFSPDKPGLAQRFNGRGLVDRIVRTVSSSWARTQGEDFATQLNAGIRYLDLRICQSPKDGEIYLCHAQYSVPVEDVISAADAFCSANPREIVILDFNHFYAMSEEAWNGLGQTLLDTFGSRVVPASSGPGVTVGEIWDAKQQVVIFYDGQQIQCSAGSSGGGTQEPPPGPSVDPRFWSQSQIQSCWPNTDSQGDLLEKLKAEVAQGPPAGKLWVLQGILTESAETVIAGLVPGSDAPSSMEQWATYSTTPAVSTWIANYWQDAGLNIVIVDWYESASADYVQTVIALNQSS